MLLHQRIDYPTPPQPGTYVRIPLSSTLWTMIESRFSTSRSPVFPSRIMFPEKEKSSVTFSGVDTSTLLEKRNALDEYRIIWRTMADPEDPNPLPESLIAIPLQKTVSLAFSYGSPSSISFSLRGIDVTLSFDISTHILSTSWFQIPFSASWNFVGFSKRLLTGVVSRLLISAPPSVPQLAEEEESNSCKQWLLLLCLRPN